MLARGQTTKGGVSNPAISEPTFQSTTHLPLFSGALNIPKTTTTTTNVCQSGPFPFSFFGGIKSSFKDNREPFKKEGSPAQAASAQKNGTIWFLDCVSPWWSSSHVTDE